MLAGLRTRHVFVATTITAMIAVSVGCSGLLGFSDYSVGSGDDASMASETSTDGGDATTSEGGEASCNVDLTKVCYPCDPSTTDQFLNSCSDGMCIPFDQTRLMGLLAPDGGLPPLPPPDGG